MYINAKKLFEMAQLPSLKIKVQIVLLLQKKDPFWSTLLAKFLAKVLHLISLIFKLGILELIKGK